MNPTIKACLHKMSNLALDEPQYQTLSPLSRDLDGSDTISISSAVPLKCYVSSDSEGVQSAPELNAAQRKCENDRMYPLDVKLYWTYEEFERDAMNKKRKRRVGVYNGITVKRQKCVKECGEATKNNHLRSLLKQEIGYEADDEN